MERRFLEDIAEEDSKNLEKYKDEFELLPRKELLTIIKHPVICAATFYLITRYLGNELTEFLGLGKMGDNERITIATGAASAIYFGFGSIKDYYIDKISLRLKQGKNLAERIYNTILDNPKPVSLAVMLADLGIVVYSFHNIPETSPIKYEFMNAHLFAAIPLTGILTELTIKGLRTTKRIKKSIKKIKTKTYEKAWNFIFEHPVVIGSLAAAYQVIEGYNKYYENADPQVKRTIGDQGSSWHVINGSVALAAGLLAAYGLTLTGSALHTHSLRTLNHQIRSLYYRITGNNGKAIAEQEKLASLPDSLERKIEVLIDLGNLHYKRGNEDEAFRHYRRAIRLFDKKDDSTSYLEFFKQTFSINKVTRFLKRQKENNIYSSLIDLLNKDVQAIETLKNFVENNKEDYRLRYIYGKALTILGFRTSGRKQKLIASYKCLQQGVNIKTSKESKRRVFLFDDKFLGEEVLATENDYKEPLDKELEIAEQVVDFSREFENYYSAIPIGIIKVEDKYWYVLEKAEGELLKERVRKNKASLEDFLQVADFMALFHARMDVDLAEPERDYIAVIKERLEKLGIERQVVKEIEYGMHPITENVDRVRKVFKKDAHFGNWIILDYGGILMLDTESGQLAPITLDTASLTSYHRTLNKEEQEKVLEQHRKSFMKYSKEHIDEEGYKLAYLSSVILKAFEVYSRPHLDLRIKSDTLANASESITKIKEDFNENYRRNFKNYESLDGAITHLSSLLLN